MLAPRKRVFGELRAARQSVLALEESGVVKEVMVREGQAVRKGEVIALLDPTRMELELGVHAANQAAAAAALLEQQAIWTRAERDLALLQKAEAVGGTNLREVADAQSDLSIAQAKIEAARANLVIFSATGALLQERLRDHALRAPFDGVVTKRHSEAGAWIGEGGAIVDLQATDAFEAWFEVPQELFAPILMQREMSLTKAATGCSITEAEWVGAIEMRDSLDQALVATSLRVVPAVDPRSRSFSVILDVATSDAPIAAGLALTGFIPSGIAAQRLVVSRDAILYGDAGPFLFVVREGLAVPLQVRIDFPVGEDVAIVASGLTVGSSVVSEGNERLSPMARVAPISDASSIPSEGSK